MKTILHYDIKSVCKQILCNCCVYHNFSLFIQMKCANEKCKAMQTKKKKKERINDDKENGYVTDAGILYLCLHHILRILWAHTRRSNTSSFCSCLMSHSMFWLRRFFSELLYFFPFTRNFIMICVESLFRRKVKKKKLSVTNDTQKVQTLQFFGPILMFFFASICNQQMTPNTARK